MSKKKQKTLPLRKRRTQPTGKGVAKYQALKHTCQACPSKKKCCPKADARKITREEHEDARQVARFEETEKRYQVSRQRILEMEPKDAIEAMLVSQIAGTHAAISMFSARALDSGSQQMREGYERSLTRLSRTFLAQIDALKSIVVSRLNR